MRLIVNKELRAVNEDGFFILKGGTMTLLELSYYLQNNDAAMQYLQKQKVIRTYKRCPYCSADKIGYVRRERLKCYTCKREWHSKKGSFLESRHISYPKFVGLLKLYSLEFPIDQISCELSLDRKTVLGIIRDIQQRILPDYKPQKTMNAVLISKGNKVELKFLSAENLMEFKNYILLEFIRYKEYGSIYSFLLHSRRKDGKNAYGVLDRFLSFSKMKLISYRGIEVQYVYQYLYELIIKFNLDDSDFYEFVLKMLNFQRVVETTGSL